jgi:hypothetical protein
MTSDSDDLEEALRQNLKLRRELADEVAKAKQPGGIAYRLGWVLYWICLVLAGGWAAVTFWLITTSFAVAVVGIPRQRRAVSDDSEGLPPASPLDACRW